MTEESRKTMILSLTFLFMLTFALVFLYKTVQAFDKFGKSRAGQVIEQKLDYWLQPPDSRPKE